MKRLIVSALFISVFFIGISGLINSASAKFRSDEKAMELIRASRTAIGGGQNLAAVKSMTIKGTTTHFFERAGVQDVKQGGVEINFEMPSHFSKRVKIGQPGAVDSDEILTEDIDVQIVNGSDIDMNVEGKDGVFIVRKGDGKDIELITEGDGKVRVTDDVIVIRKDDGTVEEIKTDGKHRVIVREDRDGNIVKGGDGNTWVTDDGKKMHHAAAGHHNSSEMLRTTMALLMSAPNDGTVNFKFIGEGDVDGIPSNIIGVESHGSSFKLYLDAASNLPQMVSYTAHSRHVVHFGKDKKVVQEKYIGMKKGGAHTATERQMKFSDFRAVGGLLLPHRWTETAGGKAAQNIDITSYEINPADIGNKFKGNNVMFTRKIKEKN